MLMKKQRRHDSVVISFKGIFFLLLLLWIGLQISIGRLYLDSTTSSGAISRNSTSLQNSSSWDFYTEPAIQKITTLSLSEALKHKLAPITERPIDTSRYTIRMNTWNRNELLLISLNHHATCEGVALIQIIWCDQHSDPPEEVLHHKSGKVVVERHHVNSLNERFRMLKETPPATMGILSLDDDVLRPCDALDAAFIRWTRNPTRIVGFDARSHRIDRKLNNNIFTQNRDGEGDSLSSSSSLLKNAPWEYGMVGKSNSYSITLPSKACFLHRDYLDLYTRALPRPIYQHIDEHFECEDIAMSYFVSALTGGKPPLMADYWATSSSELYSRGGISWKVGHLGSRNVCVNDFAEYLGLKKKERKADDRVLLGNNEEIGQEVDTDGIGMQPLKTGKLMHEGSFFEHGDEPEKWSSINTQSFSSLPRLQKLVKELQWRESLTGEDAMKNSEWVVSMRTEMEKEAREAGLVSGTPEWKLRWLYNCATELNMDEQTKSCFASPLPAAASSSSIPENATFFVCDISDGVLHHIDGSADWMIAGPPKGTGTHEYAAVMGNRPCKNIGRCPGCLSPKGVVILCSVRIDPEDCSMELKNDFR